MESERFARAMAVTNSMNGEIRKKIYDSPSLTEYGNLAELTKGGSFLGFDALGGTNTAGF